MSAIKLGFKENIPSDSWKDEKIVDKVFGTKPSFGKIFNIRAILGFIIAMILIVLCLIIISELF